MTFLLLFLPSAEYKVWSLSMREEHKMRVWDNRVLREMFGSVRYEVTGEWRRLHNEELNAQCSSLNIIRMME